MADGSCASHAQGRACGVGVLIDKNMTTAVEVKNWAARALRQPQSELEVLHPGILDSTWTVEIVPSRSGCGGCRQSPQVALSCEAREFRISLQSNHETQQS